jgi:hypothetical protein
MAKRIGSMNELDDQDICYWKDDGVWWIYIPRCGAGMMPKHTIEEHEDGTITVTPSILLTGHDNGQQITKHGWLKRGQWQEAG